MDNDIVYSRHRVEYRQIVCSPRYAVFTSVCISAVILLISVIAAFARAPCACSLDVDNRASKFASQRDGARTAMQTTSMECSSDFNTQRADFSESKCETLTNRLSLFPFAVSNSTRLLLGTSNMTFVCDVELPILFLQVGKMKMRSISAASIFGNANATRSVYEPLVSTFSECAAQRRVAVRFGRAIRSREQILLSVSYVLTSWNNVVEQYSESFGSNASWSQSQRGAVTLFGFPQQDTTSATLFPTIDLSSVSAFTLTIIRPSRSRSVAIAPSRFHESVTLANLVSLFNLRFEPNAPKSDAKVQSNAGWSPDLNVMAALRRDATWYSDRYETVMCAAQSVGFAFLDDASDWLSDDFAVETGSGISSSVTNTLATRFWTVRRTSDVSLVYESRRMLAAFTSHFTQQLPFSAIEFIALRGSSSQSQPDTETYNVNVSPFAYRTGFGCVAFAIDRFTVPSASQSNSVRAPSCSLRDTIALRSALGQSIVELFLRHTVAFKASQSDEALLRGLVKFTQLALLDNVRNASDPSALDVFLSEKFGLAISDSSLVDEVAKSTTLFASIAELLGRSVVERALSRFIERFQSAYTSVTSFLASLNRDVSGFANELDWLSANWPQFAANWSKQAGYPLLTVTRLNQTSYRIRQTRFLLNSVSENEQGNNSITKNPSENRNSQSFPDSAATRNSTTTADGIWLLPILYRADQESGVWLMTQREQTVHTQGGYNRSHVLLNAAGMGFYRVHYGAHWPTLIDSLLRETEAKLFSPLERATLANDALNLMAAGLVKPEVAFRVFQMANIERDIVVWSTLLRFADWFGMLLADFSYETYELWRTHILTILDTAVVSQLNVQYDRLTPREKLVYLAILDAGLRYGHRDAIRYLLNLTEERENLQSDLRCLVDKARLRYGIDGMRVWNTLWTSLQRPTADCEKRAVLDVLASSRDAVCISRLLANLLSIGLPKADYHSLLIKMAILSTAHRQAVWNFVSTNWLALTGGLGATGQNQLLEIASYFSKEVDVLQTLQLSDASAFSAASNDRIARLLSVNGAVRQTVELSIRPFLRDRYFSDASNSIIWHSKDVTWRSL